MQAFEWKIKIAHIIFWFNWLKKQNDCSQQSKNKIWMKKKNKWINSASRVVDCNLIPHSYSESVKCLLFTIHLRLGLWSQRFLYCFDYLCYFIIDRLKLWMNDLRRNKINIKNCKRLEFQLCLKELEFNIWDNHPNVWCMGYASDNTKSQPIVAHWSNTHTWQFVWLKHENLTKTNI